MQLKEPVMSTNQPQKSNAILNKDFQFRLKGTIIWPHLFTPQAFPSKPGEKEQEPKYSATLILDPTVPENIAAYKEAKAKLFALPELAKLGTEWQQVLSAAIKKEFDPDKIEKYPFLNGMLVAKATNKNLPLFRGPDGLHTYTKDNGGEEALYSGVYGSVIVALGVIKSTKILFMRLLGGQKIRDGEPLAGGRLTADAGMFESFTSESLAAEDDI
jgi:hypothetical protein